MSWLDHIRALYEYDKWASDKLLAAASQVADAELARERTITGGSIAVTLTHIVQTQQNWFAGLAGEPPQPDWNPPEADIVSTLRQHYDAANERYRAYIGRLREEDLTTPLRREWRGEVFDLIPWQVLTHVVNHGTQHRAEAGIALLELGASPGDLDAIFFFDEQ